MFHILLFIHCLLCVLLIGLVLIQQGKGADMGAAWGGSSASVFGASGAADFLTKFTTSIAVAFMVTSVLLVRAYSNFAGTVSSLENPLEGSVMGEVAPPPAPPPVSDAATNPVPAAPAAPPVEGAAPAAAGEAKAVVVEGANTESKQPDSSKIDTAQSAPASKPADKPSEPSTSKKDDKK